jgi:hypothetical protein
MQASLLWTQGPQAHLTALKLDVDQKGPVRNPQGASPPTPRRWLQLQWETVLQPGLPAQLLAAGGRLLTELAHLGSEVVHFWVAQGVKLMETCGVGSRGQWGGT